MRGSMKGAFGLGVMALLAGSAHGGGGCDVYRPYLPDFDQRRAPAFDLQGNLVVPGLPGNGAAYCVPTSSMNRMAYIANHGYPEVMDGPRNWQSGANYDDVTAFIDEMGVLMNTNAATGTDGTGWYDGTTQWLNARAPGHFIVTQYGAKNQYAPSPSELGAILELGALVDICYGRYELQVGGGLQLFRTSGHACTLRNAYDYCYGPGFPELGLRNPSNTTPLYSQAQFAVASSTMDTVNATWASLGQAVGTSRTMWRFRDFDDNTLPWRMLDGYNAIWPVFGLSTSPVAGQEHVIVSMNPSEMTASTRPPELLQPMSPLTRVSGIAIDPTMLSYYVRDHGNTATPARVLKVNRRDGLWSQVATLTSGNGPMVCAPDMDLFVADGVMIRRYRPTGGGLTQVGAISLTGTVVGMGVLAADDVWVEGRIITAETFASAPARLKVYDAHTNALVQDTVIPTSVNLAGVVSIACSPLENRFYLGSSASASLCEFVPAPSGQFEIASCFSLGTGVAPFSVQVSDLGSLVYVSQGVVREKIRSSSGAWVARRGSLFDGHPAGNTFQLAVSRTNWDPNIMTPESYTSIPQDETPGGDECIADINDDGGVDGDDVIRFFELWDSNHADADVNQDGGVDGDDVIVFFERWDAGC